MAVVLVMVNLLGNGSGWPCNDLSPLMVTVSLTMWCLLKDGGRWPGDGHIWRGCASSRMAADGGNWPVDVPPPLKSAAGLPMARLLEDSGCCPGYGPPPV